MTRKKKIFIGDHKNIFIKANGNALAGAPLSFILNLSFAVPLVVYLDSIGVHPAVNALALLVPFYWASVGRMYVIDWAYEKYNIQIDPKSLCIALCKKIKPSARARP